LSNIISGYNYTDSHHALDIAATLGSPIMSPTQAKVIQATNDPNGYGNFVMLETIKEGYKIILGHLSEITVNVGDLVDPGDVVGKAGSTGNSTGPHLHFEIRTAGGGGFVNPYDIFGSNPIPGTPVYGPIKGYTPPGGKPEKPGEGARRPGDPGSGTSEKGEGWVIDTPVGEITIPDLFPDFDPLDIGIMGLGALLLFIGLAGLALSETGKVTGAAIGTAIKKAIPV
jgi:murein DD-endopeptidase MepM/ murein hydrolase activator NlpD